MSGPGPLEGGAAQLFPTAAYQNENHFPFFERGFEIQKPFCLLVF